MPDPLVSRQCVNATGAPKRAYGRRKEAYDSLQRLRRRNQCTEGLTPYRCHVCGKWHLGHKLKEAKA